MKPSALGGEEVLTGRSLERRQKEEAHRREIEEKKQRGEFKNASSMTKEEAASSIQGLFRSRKARARIRDLLKSLYEKVVAEDGSVYNVNTRRWLQSFERLSAYIRF